MEKIKNKKLGLFFTFGLSLQAWQKAGLLYRDTQLYKSLQAKGMEVTFITYGDQTDLELGKKIGVNIICNQSRLPKIIYYLFLPILKYKQLKKLDIIKTHQFIGVWPAVFVKVFLRKKYIARGGYIPSYFIKRDPKGGLNKFFKLVISWLDEFLVCRFANIVVAPSQEEIDYLHKKYNLNINKGKINTNWIETDRFCPNPGVIKKPKSVIFVGRFEAQKNPLLFLKSIENIPGVAATMIGSGRMLPIIKNYIKVHKIACEVYDDRIDNERLPGILNQHLIYVLPTSFEGGSPKTILEAMSCGLSVVSSDTFGTRNAFVDGKHGFKCALTVEALADKINFLFAHEDKLQEFGREARIYIINNFSLEKVLDRELNIIDSLL